MSMLETQGASIRRNGHWILNDVTLTVATGELQAIVGPNGSGKSTLLCALSGVWLANRGSVLLDGTRLTKIPRRQVAQRISFVPQEQRIDFAFTVEEIVAMGRYPHRGRFARESAHDHRAVESALERCDITHLRDRAVNTLSGGEHQRVLIARSLAVEPEFILLDEPTANLDVEHALQILELCRTLASDGHAVALATHDLNAVARYATKVSLLDQGRLVECGARADVLTPENISGVFGVRAELLSANGGEAVYVFHKPN
jgi:iron complex transport system ATP-binding protein